MPKISACIVAYCDYDEVCAAVRSVLANTPGDDFALYVVDNASPDGCGPRLAQTDFGDARVQVICLPKNLGFGKGHNSIMDRLTSDVHFILNPDVIIHNDILPQMAQWLLDHPGVVMATPQLYFSGWAHPEPAAPQAHPVAAAGPPAGPAVWRCDAKS